MYFLLWNTLYFVKQIGLSNVMLTYKMNGIRIPTQIFLLVAASRQPLEPTPVSHPVDTVGSFPE
jgi:hypothetical protein